MGFKLKTRGIMIMFGEAARSLHFDIVSLSRYKAKYEEVGREGIPVMISHYPGYLKANKMRWLLPIIYSQDGMFSIMAKKTISLFLNPPFLFLLQQWASLTDRYSWAYCPMIFRILLSGWILQGTKSKANGVGIVTYT